MTRSPLTRTYAAPNMSSALRRERRLMARSRRTRPGAAPAWLALATAAAVLLSGLNALVQVAKVLATVLARHGYGGAG